MRWSCCCLALPVATGEARPEAAAATEGGAAAVAHRPDNHVQRHDNWFLAEDKGMGLQGRKHKRRQK